MDDGRIEKQMDVWMDEGIELWLDDWKIRWSGRLMDGWIEWMNGNMDEWTDRWIMDGKIDGFIELTE